MSKQLFDEALRITKEILHQRGNDVAEDERWNLVDAALNNAGLGAPGARFIERYKSASTLFSRALHWAI